MTSKIPICFLVIDNDSTQREIIKKEVLRKLIEYDIHYYFYNPNNFMVEKDDDFVFDETGFVKKIDEDTKGKSINLIAIDYNLLDDKLKGIDVVNILQDKSVKNFKNCQFIIHSAAINEASDRILKKIEEKKGNKETLISEINNLINSRISLSTKQKYPSEIVRNIKENMDVKSIIINAIEKLELVTINYGNSDFDGLSVSKLMNLFESDDLKGQRFIKEFIELSIAHFGSLNE
ncbi:hypothetical protein [Chryseobacterium arthrosphaerae]|uniref:hypothetical protein n=1 Tax=Chryseobacterium arthrosphaerae TaxID=651561 RepID=UPI001E5FD39F|nr:hypothetical protein [Chryseobacterium arthrosphaerae]UEQ78352.1 hypothetical protein J8N07_08670 [Chryseobacterium arthrosphaerae]